MHNEIKNTHPAILHAQNLLFDCNVSKATVSLHLCICPLPLGYIDSHGRFAREDSSNSDDGGDSQSTIFIIGGSDFPNQAPQSAAPPGISTVVSSVSLPASTFSVATTPTSPTSPTANPICLATISSSQSANAINSNERLVSNLIATEVQRVLQT